MRDCVAPGLGLVKHHSGLGLLVVVPYRADRGAVRRSRTMSSCAFPRQPIGGTKAAFIASRGSRACLTVPAAPR